MPLLPGARTQWLTTLRELIKELSVLQDPSSSDAPLQQPGGLNRHQMQRLVRAGLLLREGSAFLPTPLALAWYGSGDAALLVEILHSNVRFVGEVMDALVAGPRTHEQLVDLARSEFYLPWDTPGPVRDRTSWLVVTGMVDLFDGHVHLTNTGHNVLARLVLGRPQPPGAGTTEEITPAVGPVADLIGQLDDAGLRARADGANLYVPGTSANGGRLAALQVLIEAAIPSIKDSDFVRIVQGVSPNARSVATARTAKDTLKSLGLIQRTSSETWIATPAALAWVESGEPLDLARTVHASIAFFGEVLGELDEALRPTSGTLVERSRHYLPNREKPLSRSAVNMRLGLLEACGLVTRLSQTTYRTTPLGRAFKDSVPCLSGDGDAAHNSHEAGTDANRVASPDHIAQPISPGAAAIAAELEGSARDSANPKRLEKAAISALGYLGMPGEHIGGNGTADGRVRFGVGADARTLAVEAKTSATGRVADQSLFGLPEHRAQIGAHVTLLIGPGFERRMLKEADDDPAIAVIDTTTLAEVVRRQEQTPLTLAELTPLIDPALHADQRQDALRGPWEAQKTRSRLEYTLVDILNMEAEDPLEEGGWLDLTSIRRELRTRGYRIGEGEVVETLNFLTSTRIGVLQSSELGYRSTASVHTAGQRLRALGRQWAAAVDHQVRSIDDASQG